MLAQNDVLHAYDEGLKEPKTEPLLTRTETQKQADATTPPNISKGKADKMPPLKMQVPDPLKQFRQQLQRHPYYGPHITSSGHASFENKLSSERQKLVRGR